MKTILLILVLQPALTFAQQEGSPSLADTERKRSDAIAAKDFDLVASLYDDRFHGTTASGKSVNKEEWVALTRANNPHIFFSTEDVKATTYGNMGIVTGKVMSKSKSGTLIGQSRYLLIYLLQDDQWKVIESQETIMIER